MQLNGQLLAACLRGDCSEQDPTAVVCIEVSTLAKLQQACRRPARSTPLAELCIGAAASHMR